jgi:DNA-binding XRE family transcriptional regulator
LRRRGPARIAPRQIARAPARGIDDLHRAPGRARSRSNVNPASRLSDGVSHSGSKQQRQDDQLEPVQRSEGTEGLERARTSLPSSMSHGPVRQHQLVVSLETVPPAHGDELTGPSRGPNGLSVADHVLRAPRNIQDANPRRLAPGLRSPDQACFSFMPPLDAPDPELAGAIRALRNARGFSQEDVAYAAGLTSSSYSRIERGITNPAWTTVLRIANGLGVTLADLVQAVEGERE